MHFLHRLAGPVASKIGTGIEGTGAGGLVPIQRITSSAVASYDFTTGLNEVYRTYVLKGFLEPTTDDVNLLLRTDSDGGVSFDSTASDYAENYRMMGDTATEAETDTATSVKLVFHPTAGNSVSNGPTDAGVEINVQFTLGSATKYPAFIVDSMWQMTFTNRIGRGMASGTRVSAAAINAVQLLFDSGNIASGDVTLYGVVNA